MLNLISKIITERTIGFEMEEVMSGTHRFVNDAGPPGEFPMEYRLHWGHEDVLTFFNPFAGEFMTNRAYGTVTIGEFVQEAPCEGTLELLYVTEAKIRYRFTFRKDGKTYEYVGEKIDLRPWNIHRTHTTCYGTLYEQESGKEISRSVTYFRLATLPSFMASFKLL
jgi:hypothetical protein